MLCVVVTYNFFGDGVDKLRDIGFLESAAIDVHQCLPIGGKG